MLSSVSVSFGMFGVFPVSTRRDIIEGAEMLRENNGIAVADFVSNFRNSHIGAAEEMLCHIDAAEMEIPVRRHSELLTEYTDQMMLAQVGKLGKIVQMQGLCAVIPDIIRQFSQILDDFAVLNQTFGLERKEHFREKIRDGIALISP